MDHLVYLDHAATTAARPEVVEAMLPYFTEKYGNPSSIYSLGSETKAAIAHAREVMGDVHWDDVREYIFYSWRQ